MSNTSARSITGIAITTALIAFAQSSAAQQATAQAKTWELRFTSGALVPTGNQRSSLKDAQMTAAQLSWLVRPSLAITGTFGWASSRDLSLGDTPKLDVFSSDLGVEIRGAEMFSARAVTFSPFAGAGGGARSYNYRSLDVNATNNLAGYLSAGGEVGVRRVAVRVEARDYVSGYKPLSGIGQSNRRNDVVIMAAVRFNRRPSTKD